LDSAVQSQRETLTADLEARAKISIDEARAQVEELSRIVAEKNISLETMGAELSTAQNDVSELSESRQSSLERNESLLRDFESLTSEKVDLEKV
jgi:chromosome segregation ATPase